MTALTEESAAVKTISDLLGAKPPDEDIRYQNDLFYGDPGAGKTHLLGTVVDNPDLWPLLIADIDGGAMTLRNVVPKGAIEVKQVRTMPELEQIHNLLLTKNHTIGCATRTSIGCTCDGFYKSFAIDTGTEMQKLDMKTVMEEEFERNSEKTDKLVPNQRAWGKSNERIRMVVRAFKDLPIHFFMTCHMKKDVNEKTGTITYYPSLPGQLKSEIPGFFDVVGYLRAVEERNGDEVKITRILQTVKTDTVTAKDRTSVLGDIIREPSLGKMWDRIVETNVHLTEPI